MRRTAKKFHLSDELYYEAFPGCVFRLECTLAGKVSGFSSKCLWSYLCKRTYAFLCMRLFFFLITLALYDLHLHTALPVLPCESIKKSNNHYFLRFLYLLVARYILVIAKTTFCEKRNL